MVSLKIIIKQKFPAAAHYYDSGVIRHPKTSHIQIIFTLFGLKLSCLSRRPLVRRQDVGQTLPDRASCLLCLHPAPWPQPPRPWLRGKEQTDRPVVGTT